MTDTWGENDAVENSSVSGNDWGADDEVEGDGAFIRGFKKANDKLAISANLAVQDPAGAAQSVATADTYAKNNQGMPEGAELMGAWDRGDGISGGISEVAGEIGKDWGEARGLGDKFKSVGTNARAMGEGIAEQTGNMVAPVAGMIAGTVAGAKIGAPVGAAIGAPFAGAGAGPGAAIGGTVGGVLGGWGGASIGTAAIEGGGMTQQALMEAGIDPQDTEAVTAYLGEHGNSILKTAGVKGAIIGAVDTATMRLGGKMLNAPARAAADRAIAALGIDATDDAAVKLATKSDAFKSLIADDAAYQASKTGAGNMARNAGAAAIDPAGEFAGEYLGEGIAKDNWDTKNAALEAFSSVGQSGVMYAGQKAYQGLTKPLQAQVQPTPTPENPAPAPVVRPDPNAGPLSAAASLLPAPESDGTLYGDATGNVSGNRPSWVSPENDPWRQSFGPGMDQQAAQGQPPARETNTDIVDGEFEDITGPASSAAQLLLPDGRQDVISVDASGNAQPSKLPTVAPRDYVQGGRGMEQQVLPGQKYSNPIQAKNAIQKAGAVATHEAVQTGPKQFEVRPIAAPAEPVTRSGEPVTPSPAQPAAKPKGARKVVDRERDTVAHAVMRLGGIDIGNRQDTTGETKGNSGLPGIGYVWSKSGTGLDEMASKLNEQGFVPAGEMDNLGGVPWLQSVLGDHMSGRKEHFAPGSARQEAESLKQEADRQEARAAQEEADGGFDSAETIISDLLDDADLLEIRAAAAAQHAAELDEIFGDSPNETVAGTQNADRPAEEAQRPETVGSASAGEGQRPQGGQPDARAESPAEEAPSLELAQQTEAELAAQAAEQKARDKAEADAQKKIDDAKKKADNLAAIKAANATSDNFQLGQNVDDDVSGQGGMFGVQPSAPSLSELGGKPDTAYLSNGPHFAAGFSAAKDGAARVLPGYFTGKSKNSDNWLRGWDAGKAANQTAVKDEKPAVAPAKADDAPASQENKWFGSQNKADAYLKGKKMQATHEVVAISASRFEIREKAKSEPVAPAAKPATAAPEKPVASSNTIFTDEAADEARAFIKSMLNGSQLNSGVDPRLFQAGITLAGYHIEKGARSFAAFAKAMLADMGDGVRPYLKQWYMGVKYDPRASSLEGMSSAAMVDAFNLADIATEAASPAPAPAPATEQAQSLVDSFYALIRNDKMPKDNRELRKLVAEFDGKEADNARLKEAQEDLEAAIARYARDIAKRNMSDKATFSHLLGLYQQQPNLNVRTSSSIENQAYSTPAPLAYLAARLADIDRSSSVYEPTAGNGMLLMTADPKKATANELDEQRYNNLRALGFDAMQGDAMQVIESGALAEKSQDAIITNPPFGSVKDGAGNPTKISVDGYKIGQIDHLIAAEALKAMKDKGKATLILGANKVPGGVSTDDRIFFNWLYSHYNVTGHFELAGDLYNRQGAGWPVRVITINGRSSSANISPKQGVTQRVNTWEEVYEQYEQVLGAQLAKPGLADGSGKPESATNDTPASPSADAVQDQPSSEAGRPTASTSHTGNVSGTPAGNGGNSSSGKPGALASGNPQQRPDAAAPQPDRLEQTSAPGRPNDGGRTAEGTKPGKPAGSPVSTGENAFQAKYVPRASRKDEGVLIPVNMAQPMQDALSSLEDAVGDIDRFVMDELGYASQDELDDGLMGLQVDSVAAAIYQMKQGKGIVIADQTGIGKGRQAAAIIRWAERSGKTPVFVTMKDTLFSDMHGDLLDIGSDNITPLLMNIDSFVKTEAGGKLFANQANKHRKALETVAATGELPKGNNALFLTYSQINKPNTQRRVLSALAPNAIFILDESHNAGGESATGEFMRELLIDAAGVTYLSATYAKRPDNMPLYFKTDIGSAISDSGNLMDAMAQGGLPLQTVVSNNLVKAGQMFRRERSYDGVSIETEVDTANRATHEAMSDAATSALRAIVKADKAFHEGYVKALKDELEAEGGALDDVAGNQASESVDHTEFSSVVHNFIRQMLLGIKADTAADRAIEALKRGEKPLIALENTMGSFLNEYAETNGIKTGDSLGEFDYRTVLSRALERSRAVKKKDAMGNEEIVQIPLGELDFITRAAYDDAQQLIDELKIDIPVSPLDWIRHRIEQAGYSVAEITGRNRTVDYSKARPVLSTLPSAEQTDKVGTTQRFNSGTLDAIILNVSGSTGISLHASEKFKDQRKRLMIVAQPAQDINVFMQMLGRVHRTGQVQVPAYLILNADLPAEKRPTALLNGKMQSLNANTSSNTESATSIKSQDMLNKYGDQVIGAYLQDNIELAIALGINPGSDGDAADGLARKVTGRMALMPVADQQTFYAEIEEQYSSLIDYLNDSNQNELLPRTFDFEAEITKEATLVESTDEKTPFGQEAVYGEYKIKAQGKQMTPAEIRAEMDKNLGGVDGAAHAKALIAGLKQLWADNINQERRENGLGDTFDRAKYHAWLNKRVTDPAYAQTLVDQAQQSYDAGIPVAQLTPESMSTQPDQLRLITEHRIGSTWRIDINGDLYNAVVVNVRSSHKKSGNPFSASKLQIQLAVNGPLRTITVPGSQWSKIEVAPLYGLSIDNAFRDQVEGSQTAKIVTGNLLAAYGEIKDAKGTIISFTKKDGSIEQGILLPKKFDFKQNTRGDFQFRSAKDAMTFLERSNDPMTARFGIASRDAAVRVRPAHGGIVVIVPKSKARGGKYFLDKNLLSITGDFVSDGNFMQALVRGPNQAKAVEWLMRKAPLYAMPSQADDARSVLGLPPAQAMPSQEQTKPSYRLTDTDTKGIPLFSARAIAKKVMAATGLNATVVNAEADLPADLQAQIRRDKATGRVAGIYHNGTAYLVASNLRDTQHAISVMLHEAVGHGGVKSVLGSNIGPVMRSIYSGMPAAMRNELERRYAGQTAGLSVADAQVLIAEEYVAHLAEHDPSNSVLDRVVALVRKFIRELFGAEAAGKWSRGDIVQLLAEAKRAAAAGKGPDGSRYRESSAAEALAALPDVSEADEAEFVASLGDGQARAFAGALYKARGTESPFFKSWFGKSRMIDKQGLPITFVHRSYGERDSFTDSDLGKNTGTPTAALGHFLARKDVGNVERYGPVVEQFYIRMTKPKVISQDQFEAMGDWSLTQVQAYKKTLMEQGHDGLYIQGLAWPVVFEGKNIKARRNQGTFDETASTRYSLTGARDLFDRATGPAPLDRNDPFAAENRRLREDDKTLWAKAKKVFARQFAPGGLLPEAVFNEKITRDSEFQAVEFDVRHLSSTLGKAVKADYGVDIESLTPAQMKTLAEALSGRVDPSIPESTKVAIVAMRQYIDSLSGEYLSILQNQVEANMEGADQALIDKITGNLGAYVNRSYQAFDDPKWFKTVPTEVVNTARAYLASGYMEQGETAAEARRLADVTVNEMLKNGTAYDSMGAFIAEGKLGAKDLTVLIKRKEIAPEIRALLGEYMDPRLNFAKSATKMGRLVWNQRFLDRVLSFGMGTILFEGKNRPADATTQIAGEKSETYAPLNGLWTYPEVAQAFQDALGKEQMSDLYRTVVRLNGMVKYGKTILSPTTAMRNWQSAMFFSLANGHFDLTQMKKSWAALREQVTQSATGDDLTYLRKLKKLGVVYDTPYAGEMMALLQDARMDELLSSKSGTGLKWLRKANQFAQGFYSFGDDFWKIIGFENEKAGLLKAGIPLAEAEAMAAKRIRDTYPTYSMIGKAIQWLRRFPLVGTFVSFPSEIIRTSVNMLQLTAADLKSDNPGLRAIGRKRAAGIAMVSGGFYALAALTAAAAGVGDDEEEALRDLAAPWSKNSTFLYTGRDADGKLRYFDLSFLDPYGYWKRPLTAMMRDQPWEKAAASGLSDMLSPFFGADITAGAIFEVLANKKPTGGPVFNPDAGSVDQLQDIANHMRKALQPGFVSNAERLYLAGTESRHEGSGQPYDMRDEMVSLLGWRASTLDTQTGLYYRSFDFTDALSNARKTLTRTLRSSNPVTDGEVRESKQAANAQYQQAFTEMGRLVSAAQAAGMTRAEVVQTLKTSGIAQANIMALVNGRVPPMQISLAAQAKAVKQARTMRDSEHAAEIARRFRLAREQ